MECNFESGGYCKIKEDGGFCDREHCIFMQMLPKINDEGIEL